MNAKDWDNVRIRFSMHTSPVMTMQEILDVEAYMRCCRAIDGYISDKEFEMMYASVSERFQEREVWESSTELR